MTGRHHAIRSWAVLASLLAVGACSVLQVDVDVYKGPLANNPEVETEQLAVMAIGAKPILEGLRDRVGGDRDIDCNEESEPQESGEFKLIRTKDDGHELARLDIDDVRRELFARTCGILDLYENRDDLISRTDLQNKTRESSLRAAARAYQVQLEELFNEYGDARARWTELFTQNGLLGCSPSAGGLPDDCRDLRRSAELRSRFLDAEEEALKAVRKILLKVARIIKHVDDSKQLTYSQKNRITEAAGLFIAENVQPRNIGHIMYILGETHGAYSGEECENRSERCLLIYLKDAFSDLEQWGEGGLDTWISEGNKYSYDYARASRDVIRATIQNPSGVARALEKLFDWIGPIEAQPRTGQTGSGLRSGERLVELAKATAVDGLESANPGNLFLCSSRFLRATEHKPGNCIAEKYKEKATESKAPASQKTLLRRAQSWPIRYPFFGRADQAVGSGDVVQEIAQFLSAVTSVLAQGRIDDGLIQLIEDYLKAQDAYVRSVTDQGAPLVNVQARDRALARLLDALVRFAQKMLFLADYQVLFDDDELWDPELWDPDSKDKNPLRQDEYIRVLQAVGNTLLVTADDLRNRQRHETGLRRNAASEQAAAAMALTPSLEEALDTLQDHMRERRDDQRQALAALQDKKTAADAAVDAAQKTANDAIDTAVDAYSGKIDGTRFKTGGGFRPAKQVGDQFEGNKRFEVLETDDAKVTELRDLYKAYEFFTVKTNGNSPQQNVEALLGRALVDDPNKYSVQDLADAIHDRLKSCGPRCGKPFDHPDAQSIQNFLDRKLDGAAKSFRKGLPDKPKTTKRQAFTELVSAVEKAYEGSQLGEFDKAIKAIVDALAAHERATAEQATLKTKVDEAGAELANREAAVGHVAGVMANVGAFFAEAGNRVRSGADVRDRVVAELAVLEQKAATGEKKQQFAKTKAAVEAIEAPVIERALASAVGRLGADTSLDVLDMIIRNLRYERIQALSAGAQTRADNIDAALQAAYAYRSGFAFIRPSSAYLRSSYPASTLLSQPEGYLWRNLLARHGRPSLAFLASESFVNGKKARRIAKINQEIDKQFWQTINTVRVAGAGNTNYVLVKDDIGNWYVKAFSQDTRPIVEAAANLALFNAGGAAGAIKITGNKDEGFRPEFNKAGIGTASLDRALDQFATKFGDATLADATAVRDLVTVETADGTATGGVVDKAVAAVPGEQSSANDALRDRIQALAGLLSQAHKTLDEQTATTNSEGQAIVPPCRTARADCGRAVIDGLRALIAFYQAARDAVAASDLDDAAKADVLAKLRANLDGAIKPLIERRRRAVDDLETATGVLMTAAQPEPEKTDGDGKEENGQD